MGMERGDPVRVAEMFSERVDQVSGQARVRWLHSSWGNRPRINNNIKMKIIGSRGNVEDTKRDG